MTRENFAALLEILHGKARTLYFHVKGEPLLHPDVGLFADMAGDFGFRVRITTNGLLLPGRIVDIAGRKAIERVNVSLHGALASPGGVGAIGEILGAAKELALSMRPRGGVVSLRLWDDGLDGAGAEAVRIIEEVFGRKPGELRQELGMRRGMTLADGISLHPAARFVWPSKTGQDFGGRGFCRALRDQAAVLVDGTAVPCCLDGEGDMALGNAFVSGWDEILGSPRAISIREGFSRRAVVEPFCRTCGFRTRFG